jgi:hypothetical protein
VRASRDGGGVLDRGLERAEAMDLFVAGLAHVADWLRS